MPYEFPNNVPDFIKELPEGAQKIFVEVFNSTLKDGKSEEESRIAGWGAVKNKYKKNETTGEWNALTESFHYVTNFILATEGNISEVQILRSGTFHHELYGEFTINDEVMLSMVKNFGTVRPKAPTELCVDYDHHTRLPGGGQLEGKASGWFKSLRHEPGKLFATIAWTDQAAELIRTGEFRFFSPEFSLNYADKETGQRCGATLLAGALTNRPFLEGMAPVVLSELLTSMMFSEDAIKNNSGDKPPANKPEQTVLSSGDQAKARTAEQPGENQESPENINKEANMVDEKALRALLKIGDEEDILSAITKLLGKSTSTEEQLAETATKLAAEIKRADDADIKLRESEAVTAVKDAITARKLTPKMTEWATGMYLKDPDAFKKYLEVAEPVGPDLSIKGSEGAAPPDGELTLTEGEKQIAKNLHISEDKFLAEKKHIAAEQK